MKKKILAILLVVSMVAALAVGLTACNKDKKTAPAKADNAETLGTAIAVAMNSSAAGTASAADDNKNVDPYFTINGIGGINLATNEIAKYLNEYVNNAKAYIKDHNVDVKVEASNEKDGYNYKMLVTVTYKDAEGKDVSDVSTIYINAKKIKDGEVKNDEDADINGKEDYAFEAVVAHGEANLVEIKGTCTYDKEKDTMVFAFGAGTGLKVDGVGVNVKAWSNDNGGVVVEVNVGVDNACKVNVKVELGKISDTEHGAKVYVDVAVGKEGQEAVKVNVVANVISNANATNLDKNDFAINGTATVVVESPVNSVNVNVDISGKAKYVPGEPEVEKGKYVVQVSGNASVQVG